LLLSLALKWSQQDGVDLKRALATVTCGPAAVLGASLGRLQGSVGHLAVGGAADLCVFDPNAQWLASAPALRSQGKHTPFSSYEMLGRARCTVVDGQVAFHA